MTGQTTRTPNGKVAIVTGAAQGIGAAIVARLARDGFDVVIADLKSADAKSAAVAAECEALGARAAIIPVDVRSEEDVGALVEATVAKLGRVDGEFPRERGVAHVQDRVVGLMRDSDRRGFQLKLRPSTSSLATSASSFPNARPSSHQS